MRSSVLTEDLNLRTKPSFWQLSETPYNSFGPLLREEHCEIAIIGGGITGALLAYYLVQAGIETVLLDKRTLGTGSTAASTALLLYETDLSLSELCLQIGEQKAVRSYQLGLEATQELEALCAVIGPESGFHRCPSLYLASNFSYIPSLEKELRLRKRFRFEVEPIFRKELNDLLNIEAPYGLVSTGNARLNPVSVTMWLLEKARFHGARIYQHTTVNRYLPERSRVKLLTESQQNIFAHQVIFATGYESERFASPREESLKSTFVTSAKVSSPERSCLGNWLVWESSRPYFYMRGTDKGDLLLGGGDEHSLQFSPELLAFKQIQLCKTFHKFFPDIDIQPDCVWGGIFGETADGLPYIGAHPHLPHAYFALGYGGNGITFGVIAASILRDLCRGRRNSDANIFSFDRK